MSEFVDGYLQAVQFTSEGVEELDGASFAEQTRLALETDARRFYFANTVLIHKLDGSVWQNRIMSARQMGIDFWLTRNRHGAGFWDGDYPEPAATTLTIASHDCGEVELYRGDDGLIYC